MKIGIIGGGAAGFFAAINIAEKIPGAQITILEKSNKVLSKVKVSGGGRCNVTNGREKPAALTPFYPRGGKKLYKSFQTFGTNEMRHWLEKRGIPTKTEEDLRVFPASNTSQTIIDCFLRLSQKHSISVLRGFGVSKIEQAGESWQVHTNEEVLSFDQLIVASGASEQTWRLLENLGLQTATRVPSLFTFNIKDPRLKELQGLSFPEATIKITTTKLVESGPLLITHWGLSGPAVLKLSAWGAERLAEKQYTFEVIANLINQPSDSFRAWLKQQQTAHGNRQVGNLQIEGCPNRYFQQLLDVAEIPSTRKLAELSKKDLNKITEELTQAHFSVKGKSTFKEEFVTCGGVSLNEIDLTNMQAKRFPGLYLAGEVINIDALTGGFNFQACWTGGWLISEHLKTSA
ncbi:MAG: aminoacetone oxidase family FAD-binding enzyme [Cytophagales bacterium]|nr:aminoacetone oxidase family FAD-binding enzyme [Cytophagales bacterium]